LIGEVVIERGADIFMGEVDAAHAFVVGGERDGDMVQAVEREGMLVALDAQNALVGAQVDFDHDMLLSQLLQQLRCVVFIHNVDAVADALRMTQFNSLADVEAQTFGWDETGRQLAGVQADVHPRIEMKPSSGMTKLIPTKPG